MEKSHVTDYVIGYLEKNNISPEETAKAVKVPLEKLKKGYQEALYAEEFLELCVYLGIRPEEIKIYKKSMENVEKNE